MASDRSTHDVRAATAIQARLFVNAMINDISFANRMLADAATLAVALRLVGDPAWVCERFIEIHHTNDALGIRLLFSLSLAEEKAFASAPKLLARIGDTVAQSMTPAIRDHIEATLYAEEVDPFIAAWWRETIALRAGPTG